MHKNARIVFRDMFAEKETVIFKLLTFKFIKNHRTHYISFISREMYRNNPKMGLTYSMIIGSISEFT